MDRKIVVADTLEMVVSQGALNRLPQIVADLFKAGPVFLAADGRTWDAAGGAVEAILGSAGIPVAGRFVFPGEPGLRAEYAHAVELAGALRAAAARTGGSATLVPISVGSGTVNDLVKRAAYEAGMPYLCVATAASVDGYTSSGAALLDGGFKKTFPCPAPRAVVADESVLKAAPPYLASSGFGDLAGKIIAGTDWIIAETAAAAGVPGTEPVDPLAWEMTQAHLADYLARTTDAVRGDAAALSTLFEALALTGFAMQKTNSSRPVSGCEHLYSHVWEMADLAGGDVPATHGHKVALGTLCAAGLTHALFARTEPPALPLHQGLTRAEREAEVRREFARPLAGHAFAPSAAEAAVAAALGKFPDEAGRRRLHECMADSWQGLRERVLARLHPYGKLRDLLRRAGCPVRPEELGLMRAEAIKTARRAQMIRVRYTVLDLAWDLGVLDDLLANLETDGEYLTHG